MKIFVTAGGGGHFASAIATINKFPRDWKVAIIGRKHPFEGDKSISLESQTAKELGLAFYPLTTGRLQRSFTKYTIPSLLKVPGGFIQALRLLKKHRPDIVVSFGGYVSVPVVWAAALLQIPIVIHEQTLRVGLANKLAIPFAQKICLSWDESRKYFPKEKALLTGNPIVKNNELRITNYELPKNLPILFITGGSGGAHGINLLIEGCLNQLLEKYSIIHQTGDAKEYNDFERLEQQKQSFPESLRTRYILKKFISHEEMVQFMHAASLVVARSGIGTVTQLLALGKPSLLIPLPTGQRGEQKDNASFMAQIGIAEYVDQKKLTSDKLEKKISTMMDNLAQYQRHSADAKNHIQPDAAEKIRKVISDVSQAKTTQKTPN